MFALNIEERYVMKPIDGGQIYFILPYQIPSEQVKMKDLSVDITYLTNLDSVTMNISVYTENELNVDSIMFIGNEKISICDFQTFFIEKEGRVWLHRYSLRIPWKILNDLYSTQDSFSLCICAREDIIRYAYPSKAWKTEQEWMNQILYIIARNQQFYK